MVISRRDIMGGAVVVTALAAARDRSRAGRESTAQLIDAHAHLFNATDLPVRHLLNIILLNRPPEQATETLLTLEDSDILDWLVGLFVWVVANRVPTARQELDVLEGRWPEQAQSSSMNVAQELTQARVAEFIRALDGPTSPERLGVAGPGRGRQRFRDALTRAARASSPDVVAREAFGSLTDVGAYLRWFNLFTLYRHTLASQLEIIYDRQEIKPILFSPALINFSRWVGEPAESPLEDQIKLLSQISLRSKSVPIHGYVGFDPLAQVYYWRGREERNQLELVRSALLQYGFIGVKLYPLMGFKPLRNERGQEYPRDVVEELGGSISDDLNRALHELYKLCTELDAPILAHGAAAWSGYGTHADPAYWTPVLQQHGRLRLCLAGFGRFAWRSQAAPPGAGFPENTWEWAIGRHLSESKGSMVFADLTYLTEAQSNDRSKTRALGRNLRHFISEFDQNVDHLLFGSDWILSGQEPQHAKYAVDLVRFLKSDVGLRPDAMHRVLVGNAVQFMGLRRGDRGRERLEQYYRSHGASEGRLALWDDL